MTVNRVARPDFVRTDVDAVLVAETTVEAAEVLARLEKEPWPAGLISFNTLASTEGGPREQLIPVWCNGCPRVIRSNIGCIAAEIGTTRPFRGALSW